MTLPTGGAAIGDAFYSFTDTQDRSLRPDGTVAMDRVVPVQILRIPLPPPR